MFDINFGELAVIGVVALVVIGPERLPRVARTAGHLLGRLQRHVAEVKADISREIQLDEMRRLQAQVTDSARELQSSIREQAREFEAAMQPAVDELKSLSSHEVLPVESPAVASVAELPPSLESVGEVAPVATDAAPVAAVDDTQLDLFGTPAPASTHKT
ncbi:hypothetical protein GCM10025771_20820 [Niveibacterium umoris]|uniref:Sec-independent protein translocase protein TatB n=1 Tax=Niveibacterium umoris TaxID=1193620 RepID=A0A840BME0_9RHOO|nr:Sec-independent protein translocase protein TatB [Niveibacterium umoris]MBB4012728.1 sec-independent protein translocase protein TatB [Niveibacterium umoris]